MTGNATLVTRADLLAALAQLPSIEQVIMPGGIFVQGNLDASGGGMSRGVWGAPIPCKLVAFKMAHWNSSDLVASNTNFYSVVVQRTRAKTNAAVTSKATTLGNGWNQRTAWNFDVATFDPTNQLFSADDWLSIAITQTGAPATLTDLSWSARFEPT